MHALVLAIKAYHGANAIAEVMPMGLHDVVQLVIVGVHAACSNLMQLGLPHMGARLVNQRHVHLAKSVSSVLIPVPQLGGELSATRATPHNHDPVYFLHKRPSRFEISITTSKALQSNFDTPSVKKATSASLPPKLDPCSVGYLKVGQESQVQAMGLIGEPSVFFTCDS